MNATETWRARASNLALDDLPDAISQRANDAPPITVTRSAANATDAALLMQYMRTANWNVTLVSRQLAVSRMTLYRRMKRYGIEIPTAV